MNAHCDQAIDNKLTALRQIAQHSPELRGHVDAALVECLSAVLSRGVAPTTTAQVAKVIIKARSARERIFGADIFRDPAWDMLLDLYVSQSEGRETSISSLCIAGGVPATTGLRYIAVMEERGVISRCKDRYDARRVLIELNPLAVTGVEQAVDRFSITS